MLHFVRDVVESRVAVDLALRRLEQFTRLIRVARHDLRRRHDPQAHPFEPPRVGVARVGERELRVRSMNAANVAMREPAFRTDENFPKRPVTGHPNYSPTGGDAAKRRRGCERERPPPSALRAATSP